MSNKNLHKAKKEKNDEFYTRYEDIEKEISHYNLKGKSVYSPCDDFRWSNFKKYFKDNFEKLGITKYCCTNYDIGEGAFKYEYDGINETITPLNGNGDFRSEECIEFLKEADVVVTNPPFSLFREYVAQLMEYGKKFLIIGNGNAVTYKEIFPLIKENKLWIGHKSFSGGMDFVAGENYDNAKCKHPKYNDKGEIIINVMMCIWYTNIDHKKRHEELDLYRKYSVESYPKYDNYDAINVDRVKDIPYDYNGIMGVPITFLDKYCPEQFEIVGYALPTIKGKNIYSRILIKVLWDLKTPYENS